MASGQPKPATVYLLWHTDGHEDEKLIGVYGTADNAAGAIDRLKDKPGFSDAAGKFEIAEYELDEDHWSAGFTRTDGVSLPTWFRPTHTK